MWNYVVPCVMLNTTRQAVIGNVVLGVVNAAVLGVVAYYLW